MFEFIRQRLMSKTYWFGGGLVGAGVAQPYYDLVSLVISLLPGGTGTLVAIIGGLILWLREVTNNPLSAK